MRVSRFNREDLTERGEKLMLSISGIRGAIRGGLDPLNAMAFAAAFSTVTGKRIVVGRDERESGAWLKELFIGTLLAAGKEVLDGDVAPTPSIKCAVNLTQADAGLVISASHNPFDWNGFKFIRKGGAFFTSQDWERWFQALRQFSPERVIAKRPGSLARIDAIEIHLNAILQLLKGYKDTKDIGRQGYRVAVDGCCGAGRKALPLLLTSLGCQVVGLHCDKGSRANFPRAPEPSPTALKKFYTFMKKHQAVIGFALDPDADRLAVVSPRLGPLDEEYTLPLALIGFSSQTKEKQLQKLKKGKKMRVALNFSTSSLCVHALPGAKIEIVRTAVGEANVAELMRRKKIVFGGEGNGGVILSSVPSFGRDPLAGAALILKAMSVVGASSVDALVEQLPPLYMRKGKYLPQNKKKKGKGIPTDLQDIFAATEAAFSDGQADHQDGLYLSFSDSSWLHLRSSNTEPLIRLIAEAPSQQRLDQLVSRGDKLLQKAGWR